MDAAHAPGVGWGGPRPGRPGRRVGRGGQDPLRLLHRQLLRPRRGQHAHPAAFRDRRPEGPLPEADVRGTDAVVLRHDRARGGGLRPHPDADAGRASGRRVGHQRPQVVHQRCPRRPVRHPAGPHRGRPGGAPGRHLGLHRRCPHRRLELVRDVETMSGSHNHCEIRIDGPARAGVEHARRTRPGAPARAEAARPGPPGPLHAVDGPDRDGARHDGRRAPSSATPTAPTCRRSRASSGSSASRPSSSTRPSSWCSTPPT